MLDRTGNGVPAWVAARRWPLVLVATANSLALKVVNVAELPVVVARTLRRVGAPADQTSLARFLEGASAHVPPAAPSTVVFAIENSRPGQAVRLVSAWAREANAYRVELDTRAVRAALRDVEARLAEVKPAAADDGVLYRSLVDKKQQLLTVLTVQQEGATLIRPAADAATTRRGAFSSAVLGTLAGAILGIALLFASSLLFPRSTTAVRLLPRSPRVEQTKRPVG